LKGEAHQAREGFGGEPMTPKIAPEPERDLAFVVRLGAAKLNNAHKGVVTDALDSESGRTGLFGREPIGGLGHLLGDVRGVAQLQKHIRVRRDQRPEAQIARGQHGRERPARPTRRIRSDNRR
jgi:hypothetical protein